MGFIAVDIVAIEIGAVFLLVIAVSAVGFSLHIRLLRRTVQRRQAELRAQGTQAATVPPIVAERLPRLEVTTAQERWAEARRANAKGNNVGGPPAERPAPLGVATR